jgi:hypothetical protein
MTAMVSQLAGRCQKPWICLGVHYTNYLYGISWISFETAKCQFIDKNQVAFIVNKLDGFLSGHQKRLIISQKNGMPR